MGEISLRAVPDDDGVWRIHVSIRNERFSGVASGWGDPQMLLEFADRLSGHPLRSHEGFQLGHDELVGDDLIVSPVLRPLGPLGQIEARIELADSDDPSCRLKAKLATTYAAVDRFVPQLRRIASGDEGEAVLEGQ